MGTRMVYHLQVDQYEIVPNKIRTDDGGFEEFPLKILDIEGAENGIGLYNDEIFIETFLSLLKGELPTFELRSVLVTHYRVILHFQHNDILGTNNSSLLELSILFENMSGLKLKLEVEGGHNVPAECYSISFEEDDLYDEFYSYIRKSIDDKHDEIWFDKDKYATVVTEIRLA